MLAKIVGDIDHPDYKKGNKADISVQTKLLSSKIVVHKLRGHDHSQPSTRVEFDNIGEFLLCFKDFKNIRKDSL